MLGKLLKLILLLAILGIVASLYHFNSHNVVVTYGPESTIETSLAHTLLATFLFGVVSATLIALFFGFLNRLKMGGLKKNIRLLKEDRSLLSSAREALALNDSEKAKNTLAKIIQRTPEDLSARILLAQTFGQEGDTEAALNILRQARAEQNKNAELLMVGAELNSKLGNETAAFDNAAMVLELQPKNPFVLRDLVKRCSKLERPEDAVKYQEKLTKLLNGSEYTTAREKLTKLKVDSLKKEFGEEAASLKKELEKLLRKDSNSEAALSELAAVEGELGNTEVASKLLRKAFISSKDSSYLEQIAEIWMAKEQPSRALEYVKAGIQSVEKKEAVPSARLVYMNLLLKLGMVEETKSELEKIDQLEVNASARSAITMLKSGLLTKEGKLEEANELLRSSILEAPKCPRRRAH